MNISELFIRKPIMTTLLVVVLLAFGINAYLNLPVSSLPDVEYPVITITASYPGASPATMASTVATPIESECMEINGLQSIISANKSGSTSITLTFDLDRDVDLLAPDVQAAISRAQNNLPDDLPNPPTYSKDNPSDKPIIYLMVLSETLTAGDLYDYANRNIAKKLNIIEGVSQVQIWGAKRAIRIQAFPRKLASYGLGLDELAGVLAQGTVSTPGGDLNGEAHTYTIEPQGQLYSGKEYGELIVAYRDSAPVRLKDVANCVDSLDNYLVDVRYGVTGMDTGMVKQCVCLAISKESGANTVSLAGKIRRELKEIRTEIPESVTINMMYDGSVPIIESINDVQMTIIVAIILVVIIIFLFLGRLRETIIPSIVLPIALVGTFVAMSMASFSLDTLSLMGLVLCVGFLVDDAIVVLENTVRHIEDGLKPIQAAIKSMSEISGTVISTSVALVIVFVPLVFMGGIVGRTFQEFALTVIFAIIVSTILALTLTPVMCSRILHPTGGNESWVQKVVGTVIKRMVNGYSGMLHWTLKHKIVSVLIWAVCIGGTGWFFTLLPKTFLPPGDSGCIFGQLMMPQGVSTEQISHFQDAMGKIIMVNTNVQNVFTGTGLNPGAEQNSGYVLVVLKDQSIRAPINNVVDELNMGFGVLPYGMVFMEPIPVIEISAGGESTAEGDMYSYTMSGTDRDQLYDAAQKLEARMRTLDGFVGIQTSVKLDMPQLNVNLKRDQASTLGISAANILNTLLYAYAKGKVTTFHTDNDLYDVILQVEKSQAGIPSDLEAIYVRSPNTGALVPLRTVADWVETVGPQNVPHSEQLDSATISFNLRPDVPLGNATKALDSAAAQILPASVSGEFKGQAEEFQEAIKSLVILMGVAVFLMYIVLGILYESYIHPFTVLTTLPVAAFGGLATLLIFQSELSMYAYIGMFTLLGIIAKNGILMVDFAKQEMEEGKNAFDAIHSACLIRFRPILMTGMSTIFGALPIALGLGADGASRVPLGLIIVGGMVFAQVITLFVTPGIFLYMQWVQEHVLDRLGSKQDDDVPVKQPAAPVA